MDDWWVEERMHDEKEEEPALLDDEMKVLG
jgi:hypothetical protein